MVEFPCALRRRYGFTLIELLVVVAIIAVAGSAGIGLYAGTFRRLQVEKVARNFLLTAKYGRIMAIEKQRQYEIQLGGENGGFCLATLEWNEATEQVEQSVVKDYYCKPVQFEGFIRFEDIQIMPTGAEETEDEEKQAIVFSPDGTAQTAVIQIGDGRTHYTISISAATGKAKIHFGELENAEIGTIDLDAE
jgi:prepilin-type N-terminal cleavage/methylation domain-containing protein